MNTEGPREKAGNTKSGFLDDSNQVKQKSEPERGCSSKEPGKC